MLLLNTGHIHVQEPRSKGYLAVLCFTDQGDWHITPSLVPNNPPGIIIYMIYTEVYIYVYSSLVPPQPPGIISSPFTYSYLLVWYPLNLLASSHLHLPTATF